MNIKINKLVEKFAQEVKMDDLEIELFNDHYYLCNEVRQIGEIEEDENDYCIKVEDEMLREKGERFNSNGWCS